MLCYAMLAGALLRAMRVHAGSAASEDVQQAACAALRSICRGHGDASDARRQAARDAGALAAVVASLRGHPSALGLQESR